MSEFVGDVKIDPKANLFGENVLKGNIFIGPNVTLDNVSICGDFVITQENRITNIVDSVLVGSGAISDCGIHDSYLVINGNSDNFIVESVACHKPRTYNNVRMDEECGVVALEKETNVSNNIIIVE